MSELERFCELIKGAKRPEDLFGDLGADQPGQLKKLRRRFSRVCHEDLYTAPTEKAIAREAFKRLTELVALATVRIERRTYGSKSLDIQITSKAGFYSLDSVLGVGDISRVYQGHDGAGKNIIAKVSEHPSLNDFLKNEVLALKVLVTKDVESRAIARYFPKVIEQIVADNRAITIFEDDPGFVTLQSVLAEYPKGVDPRHFVWIFKRLLTALDHADSSHIVHGAVLPSNVLIRPSDHAVKLVGWSFCVAENTVIRAKSSEYKTWYPPEVESKRPASPATDLFMAAECMAYILGADPGVPLPATVPQRLARVLETCLLRNPGYRSSSAIDVFQAIETQAHREFGDPKFVDLKLTTQGA